MEKKARVTGHPQHSKDKVRLLRQSQGLHLPQFVRRNRHFLIRLQPWWPCRTLIPLRICSRQDIDTVKGPCRPRVISIMDCQLIALDWVMFKTLLSYLLSHKATPLRQQLGRTFPPYKAVRLICSMQFHMLWIFSPDGVACRSNSYKSQWEVQ